MPRIKAKQRNTLNPSDTGKKRKCEYSWSGCVTQTYVVIFFLSPFSPKRFEMLNTFVLTFSSCNTAGFSGFSRVKTGVFIMLISGLLGDTKC